jgi:putative nucleotidyltransferase with HDIG domain
MENWEITIKQAGEEKLKSGAEAKIPTPEEIRHAIDHIQPIPQVTLKIFRMINEDDYNVLEIADEVRQDQVISAHTLRVCNSAFFAKTQRIGSLDHALALLGRDIFVKSIISAIVKEFYQIPSSGYSLLKGGIYHHAVGTAVLAERLAEFVGDIQPSIAYTAGLLHDIGKVILDQYITSSYPLFYRSFQKEKNFLQIEKEILNTDHTEVGSILAESWHFPESIRGAIRHHHHPENEQTFSDIAHVVYLSDLMMSRFHAGFELERMNTDRFIKRIEKIGLTVPQLLQVYDLIPSDITDLSTD